MQHPCFDVGGSEHHLPIGVQLGLDLVMVNVIEYDLQHFHTHQPVQ